MRAAAKSPPDTPRQAIAPAPSYLEGATGGQSGPTLRKNERDLKELIQVKGTVHEGNNLQPKCTVRRDSEPVKVCGCSKWSAALCADNVAVLAHGARVSLEEGDGAEKME